jgi:Iap family predicted aminopeptidase
LPAPSTSSGKALLTAAGAHVVDRQDRVVVAQRPAVVDDLLRAALDLGVAALHRVEVQRRGVAAGGHRRLAAPPPMPMRMPGPPSCTSSVPAPKGSLWVCRR